MKIVIANSIGKDKNNNYIIHSPSRWSESVKSRFHWFAYYPWELAYLSSLLKQQTAHDIKFVDGCLLRLDMDSYYKHILAEKPDILIIESATRMIEENLELALNIKKACNARLVFTGAHASAFPQELIDKGVDYVCIGEYELTVLDIIQGKEKKDILGLYPNKRRPLLDVNKLPWPEDSDISRMDYAVPGEPSCEYLQIQMYASRGCPGSCNFCVARHIYYDQPNWRQRKITDIIEEIKHLKLKYPKMEGVFFDEEVHNADKQFIIDLADAIIENKLNDLKFEAMCDIRFLNAQVMQAMKNAGYYKIRIGIESASKKVKQDMGKSIGLEKIIDLLKTAKDLGLKTYGTFTFGALGSDQKEDEKTIKLIENLLNNNLLDNLQLSICTPQPGTPFYQYAKEQGFLRNKVSNNDFDGGSIAVLDYPNYSHSQIEAIKNKALLVRDHIFMKQKIKNEGFVKWMLFVIKRYGIWGFFIKGLKRLIQEIKFQIIRWIK